VISPKSLKRAAVAATVVLGACVSVPNGPSILVLPGTGKTFEQFRADDHECRDFAFESAGGKTANQAATESGLTSAALGTAMGAAAGALINGASGAGVGAGAGLVAGSLVGTSTAGASSYELQRRYDFGYQQCMYLKGNRIPVAGHFSDPHVGAATPPSARSAPPAGMPPPPPPPPGEPPPPPPSVARPAA